jgi:hypothetical protein
MTKPRPAVWPSRVGAGSGPASPPQRAAPTETPAPAETATVPAGPAPAVVIPAVAVSAPYELSILGKIHGRARGGEPARCAERRGLRPGTEGDDDCRCKSNQSITHTISSPDVSHRPRHSAPPVRLRQTNHNDNIRSIFGADRSAPWRDAGYPTAKSENSATSLRAGRRDPASPIGWRVRAGE